MKQSESAALTEMEKNIDKGDDTVQIAADKAAKNVIMTSFSKKI